MKVYKIVPADFASNSYIVTSDGKTCVVIDCAEERVFEECERLNLTPKAVLLTHGHFDHVGGCGLFSKKNVRIYCGEREKEWIFSHENKHLFQGITIPDFEIYGTFSGGEVVNFAGIEFKVISTPGHTAGGVCYLAGDNLFSGDTLFHESIGRTDLPTGNSAELIQSVKKLYALGNCTVYTGHGMNTTLAHEREFNPYVRG